MEVHGERTRLACCRRRLGDDFLPLPLKSLKGDGSSESRKCSTGRRAQQASGLRSPSEQLGSVSAPLQKGAIIDSHVHLWDPRRLGYPWLDELPALNRPFLLAEFRAACGPVAVEKAVFVECGCGATQNLDEARWITELARGESRLGGIVAAVRVERGAAARADLTTLARNPLVKGVRRLLQGEADPGFCLRPEFVAGVKGLAEFGFSFDLCIVHHQLPAVARLVRQCPEIRFVLDHAGKPPLREQRLDPWRKHLQALAALPNVWCKLSGLVTEADHKRWTPDHLLPYIAHVVECFGFDRVMFGGDWPVSTLATDYPRWIETLRRAVGGANAADLEKLFHDNARKFYRLESATRMKVRGLKA